MPFGVIHPDDSHVDRLALGWDFGGAREFHDGDDALVLAAYVHDDLIIADLNNSPAHDLAGTDGLHRLVERCFHFDVFARRVGSVCHVAGTLDRLVLVIGGRLNVIAMFLGHFDSGLPSENLPQIVGPLSGPELKSPASRARRLRASYAKRVAPLTGRW